MTDSDEWMIYVRALLALIFVVGIIVVIGGLSIRTGWARKLAGAKGQKLSLKLEEILYIDPKNRVVKLRCDDKEYVLLLGMTGNLLLETRNADGEHAAS